MNAAVALSPVAELNDPTQAPTFPGATIVLDADGRVIRSWLGPASPVASCEGTIFGALDLDDTSPEAARVQLVLASAIGGMAGAWSVFAADAPTMLVKRDNSVLTSFWQPVVRRGWIVAVAGFVVAGAPPRLEADDPVERNRICVDALGLLDECDACVRHLRADGTARHAVHRMFRAVHTIKGSTRGTQLRSICELAHAAEESLEILRRKDEPASLEELSQLEADLRRLRTAVVQARPRGETDDAMTELLAECRSAILDLRVAVARLADGDAGAIPAATRAVDRIGRAADRAKLRALRIQCTAAHNTLMMLGDDSMEKDLVAEVWALLDHVDLYGEVYRELSASDAGPSLLVTLSSWMDAPEADGDATSHDTLLDMLTKAGVPSLVDAFTASDAYASRRALGLLADAQAMFEPARPRDDASLRFERAQRDLLDALDALARDVPPAQLSDARAIVQRLVWTPLSVVGRRLSRMTRTLGAELGKTVSAEIDVGDILVAPEIGRVVGEILVHAVRNAADHGIEAAGERTAAGKEPAGTIWVTAQERGDRVVLTVRDDGRGLDLDKIRRVAAAKGLLDSTAVSDEEAIDVLFAPGFSTSSVVTAVSGRGVGMDVIRSLAEEQGGSVTLASQPGRGTTLTLELPVAPV